MGSLSGLFDLTRNALDANQAALNATANNVANQNTAGYTREVVSFNSGDAVTLSNSGNGPTLPSSSGVQATTTSARDSVLEARVQQQMQLQSATSSQSEVLSQIQNVFAVSGTTSSGSTQLGTDMDSFFSSFSALASNPADAPTQQAALTAANTLAGDFNSAASQLQAVGTSINQTVPSSIDQVNALTSTIAALNQQISNVSPNSDAGNLQDQRDLAVERLSQLVGVDQIKTEDNGLTLTTQGGALLVQGSTASTLSTSVYGGSVHVLDTAGTDITAGVQGGSIGGRLTAQSVDLPAATSALDQLAYTLGTEVNTQNEAGFTSSGVAGTAIFNLPSSASGAAATISVIPTTPSAIATAGAGEGSGGNTNANALANLAQATNGSGDTASDSLSAMLAQIGSTASALSEQTTAQQATLTQLTTQRDSESAVSLDTEAANLSQYQKSYQAAAQVLTVLDQLMATAINIGTDVAVT